MFLVSSLFNTSYFSWSTASLPWLPHSPVYIPVAPEVILPALIIFSKKASNASDEKSVFDVHPNCFNNSLSYFSVLSYCVIADLKALE